MSAIGKVNSSGLTADEKKALKALMAHNPAIRELIAEDEAVYDALLRAYIQGPETSQAEDQKIRFDVQQQIKITSWQTLVSYMITVSADTTLLQLLRTIRNAFDIEDLPEGNFRLYSLKPRDLIEDRCRIDSDQQFARLKSIYLNGDPKTAPPALFAWSVSDNDVSPDKQPARKPKKSTSHDTSSDGSQSSNNSRNSNKSVFSRDGSSCVICDSDQNLEAAHVYNVERRPSRESLRRCGINGVFESANGLTKCHTCHRLYDAHLLCTDPVTSRVEVAGAYLHWGAEKDKYAALVESGRKVRSTSPGWPPHALMSDRWEQYQQASKRRHEQCEKLPEFCERCWRRSKTKRDLQQHHCDKEQGKVENLQNLLTPVIVSAAEDVAGGEVDLAFYDLQITGTDDSI